jgi:hypothetical protein
MNTTAKFKIQTRNQNNNLHTAWTTDGIGDQNEFDSAAEARVCVRALRSYGGSWTDAEYRIVGPNGVESAEMDAESRQYAIDCQLKRLGLSGPGLGRSSMVCNMADNGIEVTLSDNATDWCQDADAEEVLVILEAIDAEQDSEEIRAELASDLNSM